MLTNADITIYNKKKYNGKTLYLPTQLIGVSVHGANGLSITDKGVKDNDQFYIRIPDDVDSSGVSYIDKNTYKGLSDEDASNYYTVAKGDLIVLNLVDDEITVPSELLKKYDDDVLTVMSVTDNRREGFYTSHIKVVAE